MRIRTIRRRADRRGFTVIELLVVIAIIAVLLSLLMAGVMAVLQARDRTANQYDVNKLAQSMDVANQKYAGRKTMPGKLVLCNNINTYRNPPASLSANYSNGTVTVSQAEINYSRDALRAMFGSRFITNATTVYWDGTGNANSVWVLEGHQCLVFYLGGVAQKTSTGTKMLGFRDNALDPVGGSGDPIGPFYNFESNRLTFVGNSPFPSYLDRYGTPFAYFGGTGSSNTYVSNCPSLPGSPVAYQETQTRWTRPDGFQIISAGKDKKFGAGGVWDPTRGSTDGNARDDVSNFSGSALTNPVN